jgi:luciferase family oxidoreductase group 1
LAVVACGKTSRHTRADRWVEYPDGDGVVPGVQTGHIPISILDRVNTRSDHTEAEALQHTIDRARRAEQLGYHRFWVAEHHGVPGIAGSAPTVLAAVIAARTDHIRVGSGGVMLPNHQPLVVAEQFATLEALFPGRIDLGIGRSVGFTSAVRAALRQGKEAAVRFEDDIKELVAYLSGTARVVARPGNHSATPLFLLATGRGVDIAARSGLAVVLGGPMLTTDGGSNAKLALDRYRENFRPSAWYPKPYVIISMTITVAESVPEAADLLLPEAWAMAHARTRGDFPALEPVAQLKNRNFTERQRSLIEVSRASAVYGTRAEVKEQLTALVDVTGADELIVTGATYDTSAQADSDTLLAQLWQLAPRAQLGA